MFRTILIILGVCLPIVMLFIYAWSRSAEPVVQFVPTEFPEPTNGTTLPNSPQTIGLELQNGERVSVADFRVRSESFDQETYTLAGGLSQSPSSYIVSYYEPDSFFAISLTSEPLVAARTAAETYLQATLGLTNEQMCDLNISVRVPVTVNQFLAGEDLGLSFCPGSIEL